MSELTLAETLILSIIAEKPMHGYELNKILEDRNVRKWADVGFSSIYYVLERLESKEYVSSVDVSGKEKKTYAISDDGNKALQNKSAELMSVRYPAYTHFMTGITSSLHMDNATLLDNLTERLKALRSDLNALKKKNQSNDFIDQPTRMLFEFSETMIKAEIKWTKSEFKRR